MLHLLLLVLLAILAGTAHQVLLRVLNFLNQVDLQSLYSFIVSIPGRIWGPYVYHVVLHLIRFLQRGYSDRLVSIILRLFSQSGISSGVIID